MLGIVIVLEPPHSRVRWFDVVLPERAQDLAVMKETLFDQVPENLPGSNTNLHAESLRDCLLLVEVIRSEATRHGLSCCVQLAVNFAHLSDGTDEIPPLLVESLQHRSQLLLSKKPHEPGSVHPQDVQVYIADRFERGSPFPGQDAPWQPVGEVGVLVTGPTVVDMHSLEIASELRVREWHGGRETEPGCRFSRPNSVPNREDDPDPIVVGGVAPSRELHRGGARLIEDPNWRTGKGRARLPSVSTLT
jgi:hypothetical protein